MRIVLDTNVVISALIWGGTPYRLIEAAVDGGLELYTSPALLAELHAVLARKHLASRLQRLGSSVDEAVALYAALAISVSPPEVPPVVPGDSDDDHVIAAAVSTGADLLVSGDGHLLAVEQHFSIRIVTPAEAVAQIDK